MNNTENLNPMQDQYECRYKGEHQSNMNSGGHAMIGDANRISHVQVVKSKNLSAHTERREEHPNPPNVNKAFTILPKSYYDPMPNNFGEPVHHELYKKQGKSGVRKGGVKYG